jgi:hypothetical protein
MPSLMAFLTCQATIEVLDAHKMEIDSLYLNVSWESVIVGCIWEGFRILHSCRHLQCVISNSFQFFLPPEDVLSLDVVQMGPQM